MKHFAMLAAMAVAIAGCSDDGPKTKNTPPVRVQMSAGEAASAASANALAYRTFDKLYKQSENVAFSPLSAQMALAMTANGATGETLDEMLAVLCPDASLADLNSLYGKLYNTLPVTDKRTRVAMANSFWHDNAVVPNSGFCATLSDDYGAIVRAYDVKNKSAAADAVNGWVKDATSGVIPELVDADQIKSFVIANALYFKSEWTEKFDMKDTKNDMFTNSDFSTSSVPFMNGEMDGRYTEFGTTEIAELPFGNGAYAITLVLPERGRMPDKALADIAADPRLLDAGLKNYEVRVKMPRFKLETRMQLQEVYKAFGIERAFDSRAQLTGICVAGETLSCIVHACSVEVNEDGAEAAAATATGGDLAVVGPMGASIEIDRPFAYMIREASTGVILFMGAINKF